jgi:hypothetical protein
MSESSHLIETVDLSSITDPDVRRAVRSMLQQLQGACDRQQIQIQAMMDMLIERNIASLADIKRHLIRRQHDIVKPDRIAEMIVEVLPPVETAEKPPERRPSRIVSDHVRYDLTLNG